LRFVNVQKLIHNKAVYLGHFSYMSTRRFNISNNCMWGFPKGST
jgi:hypothetical protein